MGDDSNHIRRGTDIKLGPGVKDAGGLSILGTERHESRRVDRQLRGRSGRQGDPGSSQFFVSLEDDLMRMFGSDRIAGFMDKLGYKEGEVIQHSMITKSIERAQKKVEENNFGIRKRLLEYDDVNKQRNASSIPAAATPCSGKGWPWIWTTPFISVPRGWLIPSRKTTISKASSWAPSSILPSLQK